MKKKIAAFALAAMMLAQSLCAGAAYEERKSVPTVDNLNYYSAKYNPFYTQNLWSWCTWYTYGRAREILGKEPKLCLMAASNWFEYNKLKGYYDYSTNYNAAKQGAIMCFTNNLAVVESVKPDGTPEYISGTGSDAHKTADFISEKWQASRPFYYGEVLNKDTFVGYIYIVDNAAEYKQPQQVIPIPEKKTEAAPAKTENTSGQNILIFDERGYIVTAGGSLNVRSEPKIADGNVVGKLTLGDEVYISTEKSANGWYYVKHDSVMGYVSEEYVNIIKLYMKKGK